METGEQDAKQAGEQNRGNAKYRADEEMPWPAEYFGVRPASASSLSQPERPRITARHGIPHRHVGALEES